MYNFLNVLILFLQIVAELLEHPDTNVNALTREKQTPLDIVEALPLSEETTEIKECLTRNGGLKACELDQPRDEIRKTVTEIRRNVHSQLEQAKKTSKNMTGIEDQIRKLHRVGVTNVTNSVTVVASLFATVAFAAISTVPGGDSDTGLAATVDYASFKIFFFSNALALFTSLAVVVVQITIVRGELKSERRVTTMINKLMWLASVCTTVAFTSSSYIVVGRHNKWAAVFITVVGGLTMGGVIMGMTYYVVKSKRIRKARRKQKMLKTGSTWRHPESDSDVNPVYAI